MLELDESGPKATCSKVHIQGLMYQVLSYLKITTSDHKNCYTSIVFLLTANIQALIDWEVRFTDPVFNFEFIKLAQKLSELDKIVLILQSKLLLFELIN